MVNYPASLDSLANPTATTKRDDPGFELSTVISTLNDIAEALEAKLGTGADVAAADEVLKGTGAGATAYGKIVTANIATGGEISKRQLNYVAAIDIATGTALTAATWTDLGTNQSFTVDDANSTVEIAVSGLARGIANSGAGVLGSRIVIDSAGTPTNVRLGGAPVATGVYGNFLAGAGPAALTGLAAGSHTVKVQVYIDVTGAVYCYPSSLPNTDALRIVVSERKR